MAVNYYVDKEKKTCICVISVKKKVQDGTFYTFSFKGKAKCSPGDTFDEATGLDLAHVRALLKFKTWEKDFHEKSIKAYREAIEYFTKQNDETSVKLNKTINALDRLEKELQDMLEEL